MHPLRENPPATDTLERFMAQTFLRRYATWCIRTERYAAAQGAAGLHRALADVVQWNEQDPFDPDYAATPYRQSG